MAAQLYQLVHFSTAFIYLKATIAVYFWKHKAYVFHVNNVLIEEFEKYMKGSEMHGLQFKLDKSWA